MIPAGGGIDVNRLRQLLLRLIGIYSPSGSEREIVAYTEEVLKKKGLPVQRQPVADGRDNLLCFPGGVEKARLFFIGHLDTVRASESATIGPREEGDRIFGLGAADMKGGCAALIEAYAALFGKHGDSLPVGLVLVVGEETEGDGARALVREYSLPPAILAEGTDMRPCLSHFGYIGLELQTAGEKRHAALAPKERGSVKKLLTVLNRLLEHIDRFEPSAVVNISHLTCSRDGFAVPESAGAWLDIHLPPERGAKGAASDFESFLQAESGRLPGAGLEWEFEIVHEGYTLPPDEPPASILRFAYETGGLDFDPAPFPSHSDANVLWRAGVPVAVAGPGRIEKAHRPDEYVRFSQVVTAAETYYRAGLQVLGHEYKR